MRNYFEYKRNIKGYKMDATTNSYIVQYKKLNGKEKKVFENKLLRLISEYRLTAIKSRGFVAYYCHQEANSIERAMRYTG